MDWFLELFAMFSPNFYGYYLRICRSAVDVFFPYPPLTKTPMNNFPHKKFNWYVFLSYLFGKNFVLIKTSLGYYYFRWVDSLNETVRIRGERIHLNDPPIWIQIVHLVNTKQK